MALVNGSGKPRTFEDTLHVPKFKKNLFSVGAVTKKKLKVVFDEGKIEVWNSCLIARGYKTTNHCYEMFLKHSGCDQANAIILNSVMLWHERLGHVNFQALKNMANANLIPGLKIKNIDNYFCEPCKYGKLGRKSLPSNLSSRSTKPDEFIHTDLSAKMPVMSLGGANYYIVFKDDFSSYW